MTPRTVRNQSGALFGHHAGSTRPYVYGFCHQSRKQDEEISTTGKICISKPDRQTTDDQTNH